MKPPSPCCELTDGELLLVKGAKPLDIKTSPDAMRMRQFLQEVICEECRLRYAKLMSIRSPDELMRVLEMVA